MQLQDHLGSGDALLCKEEQLCRVGALLGQLRQRSGEGFGGVHLGVLQGLVCLLFSRPDLDLGGKVGLLVLEIGIGGVLIIPTAK